MNDPYEGLRAFTGDDDKIIYIRNDSVNSNLQYIGKATPGTATSTAKWQIQRIDKTTGTTRLWADSNYAFDNIYDNRESLSYG